VSRRGEAFGSSEVIGKSPLATPIRMRCSDSPRTSRVRYSSLIRAARCWSGSRPIIRPPDSSPSSG
jgi:hypothetical protein